MRLRLALLLALALAALVAGGCGGGDDEADEGTPAATETTSSAELRRAVFERSYSECYTVSLERLARKYKARETIPTVSLAVGRAWAKHFGAADDAAQRGRAGCLEALRQRREEQA